METRILSNKTIADLYKIRTLDPIVSAACENRFTHVYLENMTVTKNGVPLDEITQRLFDECFLQLLIDIEKFYSAVGFCVLQKSKFSVYTGDLLNEKTKFVTFAVFQPAEKDSYIVEYGHNFIRARDVNTNQELRVVRSRRFKGPTLYGLHSECALMQEQIESYYEAMQAARKQFNKNCNLPTYTESVPDNLRPINEVPPITFDVNQVVAQQLQDLVNRQKPIFTVSEDPTKRFPPVIDLAKGKKIAQVPVTAIDYDYVTVMRKTCESVIAHALKVPISHVTSYDQYTNLKAANLVSQDDWKKLNHTAVTIRHDMIQTMKDIWFWLYDDRKIDIQIIPNPNITLKDVEAAQQMGALAPETVQEVVASILGLPSHKKIKLDDSDHGRGRDDISSMSVRRTPV